MSLMQMLLGAGGVVVAAAKDLYYNYVTLLLHGEGTNNSQDNTFLDSSTNNLTITRNGNTTQGTFTPFSRSDGYWSNFFNYSTTTDRISTPTSSTFNLSSGDWTIEGWFYSTSNLGGSARYFTIINSVANPYGLIPGGSSNAFLINIFGNGSPLSANVAPRLNSWQHIALVNYSGTTTLYVDGIAAGSAASFMPNSNCSIEVGGSSSYTYGFNGYISNFRVVKGTAVYTSSFTPPTSPLTAITNTAFLTCQSNSFKDNSTNAFTVTATGSVSAQTFSPFPATSAYSASTNGGSMYFDGSGDWLQTSTSGQFTASGDFTISCWFYLTSFSANYYVIGGNWTAGSSGQWLIQIQNNGTIRFLTTADGTFAGTVRLNEWTYFSATRSGSTVTVQLNGSTIRTYTLTGTLGVATDILNIGQQVGNYWPWNGYIADFRLLSGSAITTVPTAPTTAVSGTQLLLSGTNAGIVDNASTNDLETVGDAKISTTQSKIGTASMYFDGTGDWLSLNNSPIPSLGDFTVELWFWSSTATTTFQGLFGFLGNSSGYAVTVGLGTTSATGASGVFLNVSTGASWGINANSPTGITTNSAWHHLALVRYGGTIKVYVNGNAVITSTAIAATTSIGTSTINRVGALTNDYPLSGYIDDFRVTNGIARYVNNFTPPATAHPDIGYATYTPPTTDPYFGSTSLLLHSDSTNGKNNNTFLDGSSNAYTITRNGNATQGTFSPFRPNGYWSVYFNSNNGSNFTVPSSANLAFGTGDFTIELWCYLQSATSRFFIIQNAGSGCCFFTNSNQQLVLGYYGGDILSTPTNSVPLGQWTHITASRVSGTGYLFINGALMASGSVSTNFSQGAVLVGTDGTNNTTGYLSNYRVIKGTGLYTSNFTPSTTPLTAVSGTQLLVCQSNSHKDNSSNAFTLTMSNGANQLGPFCPFELPSAYSSSSIGGSVGFDGSGDYLSGSCTSLGTSDFTIEYWMYPDFVINNGHGIFQISGTSGGLSGDVSVGVAVWFNGDGSKAALGVYIGNTYAGCSTYLKGFQWYHVAIVRSSGVVSVYINGVLDNTPATINTNLTGSYIAIGGYNSTSYLWNGYISNFRILKGTALYTSNFTPPTAPLTAIANTQYLANFTNGGIIDNSENYNVETVGNAQVSTTQSKFGGSSMYFDGSSSLSLLYDGYMLQPLNLIGDLTIEFWMYPTGSGTQIPIHLHADTAGSAYGAIRLDLSSGTYLTLLVANAAGNSWSINTSTSSGNLISNNKWYHIAIVRVGGYFKLYVDGIEVISSSSISSTTSLYNGTGNYIGKLLYSTPYAFTGYIDDFRITRGYCRYPYNFTPTTAAHPDY